MQTAKEPVKTKGGVTYVGPGEPHINPIVAARDAIVSFMNNLNWDESREWQQFNLPYDENSIWRNSLGTKASLIGRLRSYWLRHGTKTVQAVWEVRANETIDLFIKVT